MSLASFANRLVAATMTSTALSMADTLGWNGLCSLLAASNLFIAVFLCACQPETKGRTLEQISGVASEDVTFLDDIAEHSNPEKPCALGNRLECEESGEG